MDEIELMVAETFKHLQENYSEVAPLPPMNADESLPSEPGLIYHVQQTASVFVIRTLVSKDIKADFQKICERPEDYPSLRLVNLENCLPAEKLKIFPIEFTSAEVIHDQLNNRRFPMDEETMCNLSDPGFSWWLAKKDHSFQIAFSHSVSATEGVVRLGPLGDQQMAVKNFQILQDLMSRAGLELNVQNEMSRVEFGEGEEILLEELQDLFEFGVVSDGLIDIFRMIACKAVDKSIIETSWFYLQELAAMRRFWIQIQFDLSH